MGKKFLLELRRMKKIGAKIWPLTFEENIQEILHPHEGPDLVVPRRFVWIFSAETADTEAVASFLTTRIAEETALARETADGTAATRGHAPDPLVAHIPQEDGALALAGAAIKKRGLSFLFKELQIKMQKKTSIKLHDERALTKALCSCWRILSKQKFLRN